MSARRAPPPQLPVNVMEQIHDMANKRTQARMQLASKELRTRATARGTLQRSRYLDGTGAHQRLWNIDRAIKRFVYARSPCKIAGGYSAEAKNLSKLLQYLMQVAVFVAQGKERYKVLARRGTPDATMQEFLAARAFRRPRALEPGQPVEVAYHPSIHRGVCSLTGRAVYGTSQFKLLMPRAEQAMATRLVDTMALPARTHLEGIMSALLIFGEAELAGVKARLSRKALRARRINDSEKKARAVYHKVAGVFVPAGQLGLTSLPEQRERAKQMARQRRVAARAARRTAAAQA